MKSEKFIEWEEYFRQGITVQRPIIPVIISYKRGEYISPFDYQTDYENITFSNKFITTPKNIDKGIHKANRLFKYYTFKQFPGAVIFLGAK